MKKTYLICSLFIFLFNCKSQKISQISNSDFIGEYYLLNPKNKEKYNEFKIIIINNELLYKEARSENIKLNKIDLDSLNSELYNSMPKETLVLGNLNEDILLFKTNKKFEFKDFKNSSGYFIITMIGPVSVYKK